MAAMRFERSENMARRNESVKMKYRRKQWRNMKAKSSNNENKWWRKYQLMANISGIGVKWLAASKAKSNLANQWRRQSAISIEESQRESMAKWQ
jgi:hypothetical protein